MALNINQQIVELINKSNHILITTSITDTGDGLASALALKIFLSKLNKPTDIVINSAVTKKLNFLPHANEIKTDIGSLKKLIINLDISKNKINEFNYDISNNQLKIFITPQNGNFNKENITIESSNYKYDLIFTINSPDLDSLGSLYEKYPNFFYNTYIINIDNDASNEHYGQINLINLNSTSSSEIIFGLINQINKNLLNKDIVSNLFTGILIKTNHFHEQNITPQCLSTAAQLIKLGADQQSILNNINKNKNLATLNLWGRILARLKQDTHYKLAWSMISQTDFKKSGTNKDSLDGVVNELIFNSPQINIAIILYETEATNIAVTLYTSSNYDALELSRQFNPSGYNREAKFNLVTTQLKEAEKEIINIIRENIKR